MKEAVSQFPPFEVDCVNLGGVIDASSKAEGYDTVVVDSNGFKLGKHNVIDLSGLTVKDKLLKLNSIRTARMPCFDNTPFKATNVGSGIYQVTDMHLVTTSPIVVNQDVSAVGIAPAQATQNQVFRATGRLGNGYTSNNGYALPTPGILAEADDATIRPDFNLDANMILLCKTEVLSQNIRTDTADLCTLLIPVDESEYGMGEMAALETLHCYRFVFGTWQVLRDHTVKANIGASIIEMKTEAVKLPTLERFQVMDTNFNTTNPLI
tara:strand:- start:29 stop:826 length:798 start_codon:yes stop_codon:yes gene_type:complete